MAIKKADKFYSFIDQLIDQEAFIESIEAEFQDVKDPQTKDNISYPLSSLSVIILSAVLFGKREA